MSKKDTMAKLPGLFQRDGVYELRVMVPKDLQGAFGGRTKGIVSLNTTDNRQARFLGAQVRAARLAEFEEKRRELAPPKPVDRITPELATVTRSSCKWTSGTFNSNTRTAQTATAWVWLAPDRTAAVSSSCRRLALFIRKVYADLDLPLAGLARPGSDESLVLPWFRCLTG